MDELEYLRAEVERLKAINADLQEQFSPSPGSGVESELLRTRAEMFTLIANNAQDAIWTMDTNMRFTFVSPAIERIIGYTPEECLRLSPEDILTPASYKQVMAIIAEEMAGEEDPDKDLLRTRMVETEQRHKNGATVWVEIRANFLRDAEGRAIGLLGFTRDIGKIREVMDEKDRLQTQIFESQKLEAIGTIAGGIAHDFNNILMSIQSHLSLMKAEMNETHAHYWRLQEMEDQVMSGSRLTRQLLGFAGGGKYEIKRIALNDLVRKASDMFGRTRKEISLGMSLDDDLWVFEADQNQIEQVLMNLYINASQAMPEGGDLDVTTMNATLSEREAKAGGVHPGRYVRISVKDTGVGMDTGTQRRIFEPFFTTKETGEGTGMGLSFVYGIVRNHGGFIKVESRPGQGSTFHLFFPAAEDEPAAGPGEGAEGADEEILNGQEMILLVDDEEMVLTVTGELLEFMGYRVLLASSGEEAMAVFMEKGKEIDLIILDRIMPGMGGKKTFEALRVVDPHVKVIISSGYSADTEVQSLLAEGCCGFLQKPYRIQELSQKVRDVLAT
jgi:PAS domain S-box-containing protein